MFDEERFGRLIVASPKSLPEVFRLWREDHPHDPVSVFTNWVENATGFLLMDLLEESDARTFCAYLSPRTPVLEEGPDPAATMLFEGLESGP